MSREAVRGIELWWQRAVAKNSLPRFWWGEQLVHALHQLAAKTKPAPWLPPVPVVSVGSPFLGGSGKTPMTLFLATLLGLRGCKIGIVSRGYRRQSKGLQVVSAGRGMCLTVEQAGDELSLMALRLPQAIVVAAERRQEGVQKAVELGADLILFDDGFQHRSVQRDFDLVVLQEDELHQVPRLFPFGRLREPLSGLNRADLVVVISQSSPLDKTALPDWLASKPILWAQLRPSGWHCARTHQRVDLPSCTQVAAWSSIARPHRFFHMLERDGYALSGSWSEADHRFPEKEAFCRWIEQQRTQGAELIVCTEKDAMHALPDLPLPMLYLRIELDFASQQGQLISLLEERLHVQRDHSCAPGESSATRE